MKRTLMVILGVAAVSLLGAGHASAQICVNVDGACNDYFFGLAATTAPDVIGLDGFEYGCGESATRHASGVLRIVGSQLQFEFTGTNRQFDFTQTVNWSGSARIQTLTGDYAVQYVYLNGGTLSAHGASGSITVTGCAEPALNTGASEDPDLSQQ